MAENVSENQFQYSKMSSTAYVSFRYIIFKRFQADKQIQPIRFILGKLTVKKLNDIQKVKIGRTLWSIFFMLV